MNKRKQRQKLFEEQEGNCLSCDILCLSSNEECVASGQWHRKFVVKNFFDDITLKNIVYGICKKCNEELVFGE